MQVQPYWSGDTENRLREVWRSGQFSNFGPQVLMLEDKFAQKMKVDPSQVVSVTNATLGLTGALQTSRVTKWLVPSWTFAATVHAALMAGVEISLVDVAEETWINRHIGSLEQDSGGLLVLPFGSGLEAFDWSDDDSVVIDAAASIAAKLPSLSTLPKNSSIVFSLHATKVLGVGEGGLAVFGSTEAATRFRQWTNFGFDGHRESKFVGSNAKMSEVVAALNLLQIEEWETIAGGWKVARSRMERMAKSVGLESFAPLQGENGPYFIAVFSDELERNRVEKMLTECRVETRRWWGGGCHTMPAFQNLTREKLETTERIAAKYLGLPLFPGLQEDQVSQIEAQLCGKLRL